MKRGRPKGYSPYVSLTYEELGDYVGRKSIVKVSKAWWDTLVGDAQADQPIIKMASLEKKETKDEIEFNLIDLNDEE